MIDYDESEWQRIATLKEIQRQKDLEEIKYLETILKLPFYKRLQERGQEEYLKRFEENQRHTFTKHSAKKWGVKKEEAEELFQEYMTEFLNGKTKSIRTFLISRGYKYDRI